MFGFLGWNMTLTLWFVQNCEQWSHHHPVHPSAAVLHLPAVRQPHAAGGRKTGVSRPGSGCPGLLQPYRYENTQTHTHTSTDPHVLILICVCVCVCQDTSVNLITTLLISSWMSSMETPPPSLSTSYTTKRVQQFPLCSIMAIFQLILVKKLYVFIFHM